jgi:hypothetical protein
MPVKGGWNQDRPEPRRKESDRKNSRSYKEEYLGPAEPQGARKALGLIEELEMEKIRLSEELAVEKAKNEFMEAEIDRENYPLGFDFGRWRIYWK